MKRTLGGCVVCGLLLVLAAERAWSQDKVLSVGKDGLKVEGNIDDDDPKVKIKPNPKLDFAIDLRAKSYPVKLAAGRNYQIDMVSDDLDSFLVIQNDKGEQLTFDDDSGGNLNARLYLTPPKDATYKVFTASLKGTGKFTLRIRDAGAIKVLEVGNGLKIEGKLERNKSAEVYHVKLAEGKTYVIDMISPDQKALDPFLRLQGPTGKLLAIDDDGGEGLNARITIQAPATGTYQIVATCVGEGAGAFTLEVKEKE